MPIKFFPPLSGNINWGEINGSVADQTDLKSEIDGKSDVSHNHDGSYEPADSDLQSHLDSTSNPHAVAKSQLGLSNVTDDAQLKRSQSDFSSFAEKGSPASADIVLIEDSADAGNKKKVQVGNISSGLPAAGAGELLYFDGSDWVPATKLLLHYFILESRQMTVINGEYIDNDSYCLEVMGEDNFIAFTCRGNKSQVVIQTYDYSAGEIALKIVAGNGLYTETDVWFLKFVRASNSVEVFKIDFEGKIFSDYLRTTDTHPGAYKALYIDTATGKIYSQDAAAGSPSWGDIAGMLSSQADLQAALNTKAGITNWGCPNGGYLIDGANDSINCGNSSEFNLGTDDFSFECWVYIDAIGTVQTFLSKKQDSQNYYKLSVDALGNLSFAAFVGNVQKINLANTANPLTAGFHHIAVVAGRNGSGQFYIDGEDVALSTNTMSPDNIDNTGDFYIADFGLANPLGGKIFLVRYFNRMLSETSISELFNNGRPDLAIINAGDRWATQIITNSSDFSSGSDGWAGTNAIVSGNNDNISDGTSSKNNCLKCYATAVSSGHNQRVTTLSYGKKYEIELEYYIPTGQTKVDGAELGGNADYDNKYLSTVGTWAYHKTEFIATGATLRVVLTSGGMTSFAGSNDPDNDRVYTLNVRIREIGAIAEFRPERAGNLSWLDNSSNRLHGEIFGAKHLGNNSGVVEFKASITGDTALTDIVPPGFRIESVLIEETAGRAVTGGIDIGTTASGSEVVAAEAVLANDVVLASLSGSFFSISAPQTLYISAASAWNSASINVTISMEKAI